MSERAVERIPYQDLRRMRALALTSHVMSIVSPFITDYENNAERNAYDALFRTFYDAGVEVVTDADRVANGLPERGPNGWTVEEMHVMDSRIREAMLRPMPPLMMMPEKV